jgi:NADPH:quinone reductase-like Zn-dependent oxidoreductase
MKAIVVTDEGAGAAGMTLVERPMPEPAGNDVLVEVHASGFTPGELTWPGTWTDRLGGDRRPSIPAWQGLFVYGRFEAGQSVLVHGAAGGVGSVATQLAHEAGTHVIGTGRAADREAVLDFGAHESHSTQLSG